MKNYLLKGILVICSVSVLTGQVFITEIADPSDNQDNTFVEICNRGNASVNISNLDLTNGVGSGVSFFIPGDGDDTYVLHDGTSNVDIYGEVGEDGTGEDWEYVDSRAIRNQGITSPNTTWTSSEWTISSATTAQTTLCTDENASSSNDADSDVNTPTSSQPTAGNISSLDDTQGEAEEVFYFEIQDLGTSDALPTKVTNIRIKPHSTNTADWTDHIQGARLIKDPNGTPIEVTINGTTIDNAFIDLEITAGNLDIANGTTVELGLQVYLNTSGLSCKFFHT